MPITRGILPGREVPGWHCSYRAEMASSTVASEATPAARPAPDRNLALDLLRVTEAAAMAAGRWVGRRDKDGADAAAVAAMRAMMGTVTMDGVVVIGEGERGCAV